MNTATRLMMMLGYGLQSPEEGGEGGGGGGDNNHNGGNGGNNGGNGGNGGNNNGGGGNNGSGESGGKMLSAEEYQQFQTLLKNATNQNNKDNRGNNGQSAYDRLKDKDKSEADQKALTEQIKNNVLFDNGFNAFIDANKNLFSMTAEKMRGGAKDLDGQDLTDELSKIAVKDFFSKAENIAFLDAADQEKAKEMLKQHDKFIDSAEAWNLIKIAVNVASKTTRHSDFKQAGGNGGADTPNLDAYIQRCKDQGKPESQRKQA